MNARDTTSLVIQDSTIESKDPWAGDKLDSKKTADTLTKLIATQTGPLVLSVNGGWGTGKTFMLKRWRQDLENDGYAALYYSAWEDDFSDEPLVSIAGQLAKYFDADKGIWKDKFPDANKVLSAVLGLITKVSISGFSSGTVDGYKLVEKVKSLRTKYYPTLYRDLVADRDALRDKLKDLANKLGGDKPLIFIIDELDRCRPLYAISLLERIKHIFNVPNIIFVLGMNKEQLGVSIQSIYGEIDASEYLQRFVDYDLRMPTLSAEQYARVLAGLPAGQSDGFCWLCGKFELSLREVEHCHRAVRPVHLILKNKTSGYDIESVGALAILRLKNSKLYENFKKGEAGEGAMLNYFHQQLESVYADRREHEQLREIERSLYSLDPGLAEKLLETRMDENDFLIERFSQHRPTKLPDGTYEEWLSLMELYFDNHTHPHQSLRRKIENKRQQICKLFDLFPAEDNE